MNTTRKTLVLFSIAGSLFFNQASSMLPLTDRETQKILTQELAYKEINEKIKELLARYKQESLNKLETVPGINTAEVDKTCLNQAHEDILLREQAYIRDFNAFVVSIRIKFKTCLSPIQFPEKIQAITQSLFPEDNTEIFELLHVMQQEPAQQESDSF